MDSFCLSGKLRSRRSFGQRSIMEFNSLAEWKIFRFDRSRTLPLRAQYGKTRHDPNKNSASHSTEGVQISAATNSVSHSDDFR